MSSPRSIVFPLVTFQAFDRLEALAQRLAVDVLWCNRAELVAHELRWVVALELEEGGARVAVEHRGDVWEYRVYALCPLDVWDDPAGRTAWLACFAAEFLRRDPRTVRRGP